MPNKEDSWFLVTWTSCDRIAQIIIKVSSTGRHLGTSLWRAEKGCNYKTARKQHNIFEWFSHTVCCHDSTVGIFSKFSLYYWGCGQYHNYFWREDLKADVKDMLLTLLEEMDEIKGIGIEVQLAHPMNSVRGWTVPLIRETEILGALNY